MMDKLYRFITNSKIRFNYLAKLGIYNHLSDEEFIRLKCKRMTAKDLQLAKPPTFNEKIQWLKLYDRRDEYSVFVDKYAVKDYVKNKIGEEYVIPTLGVWDNFDEIDFGSLPDAFVLKTTHDSGGIYICKDKKNLDKKKARTIINNSLTRDYYRTIGREYPYKTVPRRIIAEEYKVDESGTELKDYKVFTFWGEPKMIQVDYDRFCGHKRNLYTPDWEYIDATIEFPTDKRHIVDRPQCLDELLYLSHCLSEGYPHIRCDFYIVGDKIFFGELTLHHGSGFEIFTPTEFGYEVGNWLDLTPLKAD